MALVVLSIMMIKKMASSNIDLSSFSLGLPARTLMQVTLMPQSIGGIPEEPHLNLKHETVPHKSPFILYLLYTCISFAASVYKSQGLSPNNYYKRKIIPRL